MTATQTVSSSVFAPTSVVATLTERHDPDAFFRTRPGLWVDNNFRNLVVLKAKPTEAGQSLTAKPQTLGRDASDAEIEAELGSAHLFEESALCALIAGLITAQPEGKVGPLLNNGYANLLFLPSCVVVVRWDTVSHEWSVLAWQRSVDRWRAGRPVFSPAS